MGCCFFLSRWLFGFSKLLKNVIPIFGPKKCNVKKEYLYVFILRTHPFFREDASLIEKGCVLKETRMRPSFKAKIFC